MDVFFAYGHWPFPNTWKVSGFFPWISMQKFHQRPRNQGDFPNRNRMIGSWHCAFKVLVRRSPSILRPISSWSLFFATSLGVFNAFTSEAFFLESGVEHMKTNWDLWIDGLFNLLEYDESICPFLQCFEGWEPQFKDTDIVEWSVLCQMLFGQNKL